MDSEFISKVESNTSKIINEEFNVSEFIKEMREKGILISFSNGKLLYSGPEQHIDKELVAKLKKYKTKLLKYYWPSDCPNLMPINTEGDKIPLILLHAGPANYPLSEHFGNNQPFYGYFYIGSEGEKIRHKSVESFAKDYLKQLLNILPNGPYILGGLSFGGILAFEMAIQLQKQGIDVPYLVLVDCEIPSYLKFVYAPKGFTKISSLVYENSKIIYYWVFQNTRRILYDFFNILRIKLPRNFRNSYIRWTYNNLMKIYKPITAFKGEILLFKMDENSIIDKYLGWESLCNNIQLLTLKGNHETMYINEESTNDLKQKISELLRKANVSY